jgi:hypothetical protein
MLYRILVVLFLAGTTATIYAQSNVSMELYADTYAIGYNAVVSGDFNNDGKPDLVQCCNSTGLVFRAGNGDGTFQAPVTAVAASKGAVQLIATDVNGDGNLDLVGLPAFGSNSGSGPATNGVEVWLGNGNGTFQPGQIYSTTFAPNAVAVGNFFGNGLPDIAVGETGGNIDLFRNEGNGYFVFDKALNLSVGSGFTFASLSAGDLNGNGISDLAAAFSGGTTNADPVYVLWNDGKGDFKPVQLGNYTEPTLSIASLNGDGMQDILVGYVCNPTQSGSIRGPEYNACAGFDGYYGQGNNKLYKRTLVTDPGVYNVGRPFGVDINGDGYGDIVTAGGTKCWCSFGLFTYLGKANGSFQQTPQSFIFNTGGVGPMTYGDFTRNGMVDFAMSENTGTPAEFFLNATPRAACGKYTISPTVTACQPVNDTYSPVAVRVSATTYDATPVTALQEYVDSKLVYSEPVTSFDKIFPESPGEHFFLTKAWDASGRSFRADRTVTVYKGSPGPTCAVTTDSARICLPSGTASNSPVLILANGDTGTAVPTAAQLYIDGKLVVDNVGYCYSNGNCAGGTSYVETTQNLTAGSHNLLFKLWDADGDVYTARKTVTVN